MRANATVARASLLAVALCALALSCRGEAAEFGAEGRELGVEARASAAQPTAPIRFPLDAWPVAAASDRPTEPASDATATRPAGVLSRPPLRSVSYRLIELLPQAEIEPPLLDPPPERCLERPPEAPVQNPYSPLPPALSRYHRRLTLRGDGARKFDTHDGLLVRLPRRFRFRLRVPPEPRLEFVYKFLRCRAAPRRAMARVRVERGRGAALELEVPLDGSRIPKEQRGTRWRRVVRPLALEADEEVTLEISFFTHPAGQRSALAWGEPMITGRARPARPDMDRNVLLIVVDALRSDVVGPGRDIPIVAPYMESLFARGTAYSRAYSISNQTRASTLAFLASAPPTIGGFHIPSWIVPQHARNAFYATDPPLLSRLLPRHGWRVATLGHNRFLYASRTVGLDGGFDRVFDTRRHVLDTPQLTERMLEFLEQHRDDRWFVYLNYAAPHLPYRPPERYLRDTKRRFPGAPPKHLPAEYLGEIPYTDDHVRTVIEALERSGVADRTLVVLTADHGEVFAPTHACYSKRYHQNCHRNHGVTLYEEEIHVPLAWILPGVVEAGRIIDVPTSQLHLAPTILGMLGLPEEPRHAGVSMRSTLEGGPPIDEPVYVEGRAVSALVTRDLKLHLHARHDDAWTAARTGRVVPPGGIARRSLERLRLADFGDRKLERTNRGGKYIWKQLFDLSTDPSEAQNLALLKDDRVEVMERRLREARAAIALRANRRERPDPDAAVAELSPSSAARPAQRTVSQAIPREAINVLLLTGDGHPHHLVGELRAPGGVLACGDVRGLATCRAVGVDRLELDLAAAEEPANVVFAVWPWAAPLEFSLQLDGQPFDISQARLGPFGVRLLAAGERLDRPERLALTSAGRPPLIRHGAERGVYLWRSPQPREEPKRAAPAVPGEPSAPRSPTAPVELLGPESLEDVPDEELSPKVREMLRGLGYTQ